MPTGYTQGIYDGTITDFTGFAKICMRAFGATLHMRDESLGKEYEPRVPGDYYYKQIANDKAEIDLLENLSDFDVLNKERLRLNESRDYHITAIESTIRNREKMKALLVDAEAFEPPTKEHADFKKFMIQQLESTIDFEGSTEYHDKALVEIDNALHSMDSATVRAERLADKHQSLAYYQKSLGEEIKRCNDANNWVIQLLASLNAQSTQTHQ